MRISDWSSDVCSSDLNFRAALIAALVIPITMAMTSFGMLRGGVSANLMSLGALDFGLIVDGAVIIVENALRRIAERQHPYGRTLALDEGLSVVAHAARAMLTPSEIGRETGRERECQHEWNTGG